MNTNEEYSRYNRIFKTAKNHTKYKNYDDDRISVSDILNELNMKVKVLDILDFIFFVTVIISDILILVFINFNLGLSTLLIISLFVIFIIRHTYYNRRIQIYSKLVEDLEELSSIMSIVKRNIIK